MRTRKPLRCNHFSKFELNEKEKEEVGKNDKENA